MHWWIFFFIFLMVNEDKSVFQNFKRLKIVILARVNWNLPEVKIRFKLKGGPHWLIVHNGELFKLTSTLGTWI